MAAQNSAESLQQVAAQNRSSRDIEPPLASQDMPPQNPQTAPEFPMIRAISLAPGEPTADEDISPPQYLESIDGISPPTYTESMLDPRAHVQTLENMDAFLVSPFHLPIRTGQRTI